VQLLSQLVAVSALLASLAPAPASAEVVYQYTGNFFTQVSSPYETSDRVLIALTLPSPLAANLNAYTYFGGTSIDVATWTLNAFTATDGVQSITELSSDTFISASFYTDTHGRIIRWSVTAQFSAGGAINTTSGGNFQYQIDFGALNGSMIGQNTIQPGTWAGPSQSTATPEPASVALLGVGLAALTTVRRRRSA